MYRFILLFAGSTFSSGLATTKRHVLNWTPQSRFYLTTTITCPSGSQVSFVPSTCCQRRSFLLYFRQACVTRLLLKSQLRLLHRTSCFTCILSSSSYNTTYQPYMSHDRDLQALHEWSAVRLPTNSNPQSEPSQSDLQEDLCWWMWRVDTDDNTQVQTAHFVSVTMGKNKNNRGGYGYTDSVVAAHR